MSNEDLSIYTESGCGRIVLQRQQALNALSEDMCHAMKDALRGWAEDSAVAKIIITASEGRAFCAGGDIREVAPKIKRDIGLGDAYFHLEYSLDKLIAEYKKPIVVLANGLTMGGGAGVLLNASHPIITTAIDFAMPETGIGLFPDVGASLFLRAAPSEVAVFLGLVGWRIGASDLYHYKIAGRVIPAEAENEVLEALMTTEKDIDNALKEYYITPSSSPLLENHDWIKEHFSKESALAIRQSLEGDTHSMAEKARHALDSRCPLSLALTHRLFTDEALAPKDKSSALEQDLVLAYGMIRHPNFVEGVRALLVDKDNAPNWQPPRLDEVSDAMIDAIIAPPFKPSLDEEAKYAS